MDDGEITTFELVVISIIVGAMIAAVYLVGFGACG